MPEEKHTLPRFDRSMLPEEPRAPDELPPTPPRQCEFSTGKFLKLLLNGQMTGTQKEEQEQKAIEEELERRRRRREGSRGRTPPKGDEAFCKNLIYMRVSYYTTCLLKI